MLALPATPAALLREVIVPALAELPATLDSTDARCLLVAIAIQESDLRYRRQVTNAGFGPARSPWQFERIGVRGVLEHANTDDLARMVARQHRLATDSRTLHLAMESNDALACQFARLNLLTDPRPLPDARLQDEVPAFQTYLRVWRPGAATTPEGRAKCARRWQGAWRRAVECTA